MIIFNGLRPPPRHGVGTMSTTFDSPRGFYNLKMMAKGIFVKAHSPLAPQYPSFLPDFGEFQARLSCQSSNR